METRLNDNEVREVARMQAKIDAYEGFIRSLFIMMLSDKALTTPIIIGTDFDKEMNKIWRWVKEHKDK